MSATEQLSITLTREMADKLRAKVAAGEYETESDVVSDGLARLLGEQDEAFDRWIRDEVVPAHEAYKADPSRALSMEEVQSRLAAKHARAVAKQ